MSFRKTLKTIAITLVLTTTSMPMAGQDLIAKMAPVDRKVKALDTLALSTIRERENMDSPSADLYSDWDNRFAHKATELPETYKINLRGFHMPTSSRVITSQFGPRWGRQHKGLDIKVYIGDTIRAAFTGKVRIVRYEAKGYGNYVVIRHNNGLETIYGHLSKHLVRENQVVRAGQPIGLGGNTGRSTGSHLHFETRLCGVALNPALFFDFRNQDVTGDYYVFRRSTMASESAKATIARGQKVSSYTKEEVYGGRPSSSNSTASGTTAKRDDDEMTSVSFTNNRRTVRHTVESGETIFTIAQRYNVSVEELQRLNGLGTSTKVRVGQVLKCS
ncbi:MAG: peptidoglycan DD-metalloendopeptidase family protein [Prevotella sp.]|jgi:murein DD-endopeptidase MepM/ murein hydrolase activator NlpD|nr:peptidoglycan DD-metalloendopeptidase family protein [Prevotella sp.]